MSDLQDQAEFDLHADTYDADLNQALSVTGRDKHYFARRRVEWMAQRIEISSASVRGILDYGCGIGDTSGLLQQAFSAERVVGVDISQKSIDVAALRNGTDACVFRSFAHFAEEESVDLTYCNGVFHHIPLAMRNSAVDYIYRRLRPGGWFALWENNPWNVGTRYVMSQCVFDRDAITLPPPQARSLLRRGGFEILRTDYCFFFPRFLAVLESFENILCRLPLGAQYMVLSRKPER